MDNLCSTFLRLSHPLVANRMALGHIGSLYDYAVGICHVLQRLSRAASTKRSSQTGNCGRVSNPGLVLDLYRTGRGEKFLDQVIFFVIEGSATKRCNTHGPPEHVTFVVSVFPPMLPRFNEPIRNHFDGSI